MQQKLGHECGQYLAEAALTNSSIWVLDGDLADSDGAEEFAKLHPARFISSGIAEQAMVSIAAGMASCGCRPWAFSFASFLCYRAYDQIRVGVSQTKLPVTLVGAYAGGCGGRNGKTHLALNDLSIMTTLPNIHVWAPADRDDVRFAVESILDESAPAYMRLPRLPQQIVPGEPGRIRWIGAPSEIAIVAYGASTHWAVDAQALLRSKGIDIGILHFLKVWPISSADVKNFLGDVKYAFVVEDHYTIGGLVDLLRHAGFKGQLEGIGWLSTWGGQSGSDADLTAFAKLRPSDLASRILSFYQQTGADQRPTVCVSQT
jgi:transketolase